MTKINNFKDTIQALLDGKKIQREDWNAGEFICIDESGLLVDENGNMEYIELLIDGCYEIHEEPEKELKIENLKTGDIITQLNQSGQPDETNDKMILGVCGKVAHVSYKDDHNQYCTTYTIKDIKELGYYLKKK